VEKAFRIESNAKYYTDLEKYINMVNKQKELISTFMEDHNIKANKYYLSGTGFMNCAFEDRDKNDISFGIIPTDEDKVTFSKMLCKEKEEGLCLFKKKSKVLKELQDYCIENEVVINLWKPRLRD
jgi:ABC-type lipoprotein release transport system permease subunit